MDRTLVVTNRKSVREFGERAKVLSVFALVSVALRTGAENEFGVHQRAESYVGGLRIKR